MRRCSSAERGGAAVVLFVAWVIALALVYALSQSQAQSGALTGVIRAAGLRSIQWAGRSALNEAAYQLRFPSRAVAAPAAALASGRDPGAIEPAATRQLHAPMISRGELAIGPVQSRIVSRPSSPVSSDPWQVELSVRVEYRLAGVKLSRQVRRRHAGHQFLVRVEMGPRAGQQIPANVSIDGEPMFEVMEP
jgi:stage V sporulation protein SpoVS